MMDESPTSTIVSLTSALLWPTRAIRRNPARARPITHSAPVRVFPNPRPDRNNHTNQSPGGAICSGRAQNDQSYSSASASASLSLASAARFCAIGSIRTEEACKPLPGIAHLNPDLALRRQVLIRPV